MAMKITKTCVHCTYPMKRVYLGDKVCWMCTNKRCNFTTKPRRR